MVKRVRKEGKICLTNPSMIIYIGWEDGTADRLGIHLSHARSDLPVHDVFYKCRSKALICRFILTSGIPKPSNLRLRVLQVIQPVSLDEPYPFGIE